MWEISINIVKDWLSVSVLSQYGPTMGFEEEEEDYSGTTPMLSFHDDEQVLISSENNGVPARVSFRKNTVTDNDGNGFVINGESNGGQTESD